MARDDKWKKRGNLGPVQRQAEELVIPSAEITLTPDMHTVLEGLAIAVLHERDRVAQAERRFNTYVVLCAQQLGCNSNRYMFDAARRIFTNNPNVGVAGQGQSINNEQRTNGGAGADIERQPDPPAPA